MSKSTAPVCPTCGGRLLDWSTKSGADYYCSGIHGALGKGLFFRTVWNGEGHGSTYSIEPLPGQDMRPYMTPAEVRADRAKEDS